MLSRRLDSQMSGRGVLSQAKNAAFPGEARAAPFDFQIGLAAICYNLFARRGKEVEPRGKFASLWT
jgi:hypothetical protein